MDTNYTYVDAFNELQQIVLEIESGEINVDDLATKIKRASELITICKAKLSSSEEEVQKLLNALEADETSISADEEE